MGHHGPSWGHPRTTLGPTRAHLGTSGRHLETILELLGAEVAQILIFPCILLAQHHCCRCSGLVRRDDAQVARNHGGMKANWRPDSSISHSARQSSSEQKGRIHLNSDTNLVVVKAVTTLHQPAPPKDRIPQLMTSTCAPGRSLQHPSQETGVHATSSSYAAFFVLWPCFRACMATPMEN